MKTFDETREIKEKFESELLAIEDVVGVGIGKKTDADNITNVYVIRIYVTGQKSMDYYRKNFPEKLDDVDIDIVVSGRLDAQH